MKASLKQVLSSGLMATMLLPGLIPANADESKQTADATSKHEQPTATTPSGSELKLVQVKDTSPYAEVNGRMVRVERRLVEDLATGRLSPAQTADFQKGLEQIHELEAQFRSSPAKFMQWQNVRLDSLLDKLSDAIDNAEHDRDLASADLQFTREDIANRIDMATKKHRLSTKQAADIKQRFNRITSLEGMLRKYQGKLTYVDKLMLCVDYDHIGEELSKELTKQALPLPDVAGSASQIEKRISEASQNGKISEAQAHEFKQKLSDLRAKETAAKNSHLTEDQIITLGLELDNLANRIEALLEPNSQWLNIDERIKLIDRQLAVYFDQGAITALETLELKEDLDDIQAAKNKLSAGGSLKDEDRQALLVDLARLEGRLERQLHGPSRLSPGAAVYIAHISHRISQGLAAKRLSDDDAKELKQELRLLNKKKFDYEKADGGITCEQALQVSEDLQRISAKLEKTLKDRDMDLPNIDGIKQTLETQLGEYTISGQLDTGDARTIVINLANMNSVKEKYNTSDNNLDSREKFALAYEMERISANLEEQMRGHAPFFPGVEVRRGQIEALINEGISSGRLDTVTSDFYKSKLAENSKLEKQYRADSTGLTGDKAVELVASLEHLWEQLDRELREKQVTTADIVSIEGSVEKKIRQGFSYGLLSPGEAENLRKSYDGVVESFNKMRADDGGLSYGERLAFAYGFERLLAYVERNLRSTPMQLPNLEARRTNVEQKIGSMLATGHLPMQEAQDLKGLLDEITSTAIERQTSGGGMSYQEGLIVTVDIDRLNKRVEERAAALKNPLPDVDELQKAANLRIEEAHKAGKISNGQYNAYKADLDRIAANEAAFRISDESLNYAEAVNLMMEIQRLKQQIESPAKEQSSSTKTIVKTKQTKSNAGDSKTKSKSSIKETTSISAEKNQSQAQAKSNGKTVAKGSSEKSTENDSATKKSGENKSAESSKSSK